MPDSSSSSPPGPGRPPRGSGGYGTHLADELEVYFNEVAHGRPVGFASSPKWKPPTDVYETADELIFHMDISGMQPDDFTVELAEGLLSIAGERTPRQSGKRHYHSMEIQIGPFERRFRIPVSVDPTSLRATYEDGFLDVRLTKLPQRLSGPQSVKVK
jgi:HSP20 family protein